MKNNLTAMLYRVATVSKILLGFLMICLVFVLTGCGTTPPAAFEKYLFETVTNYAPHVETVTVTNTVTVSVTNTAGVIHEQPVVSIITTQQTNILATVTTTPSLALKSWAGLASGVANTASPGSGGIVGLSLLGIAGFFGLNRQRKLTQAVRGAEQTEKEFFTAQALAENFAQSIEVLREVLKTTPQGQALDVKIVDMLARNQMTVGLIRDAAALVDNTVSNEAAKTAAQKILALLPPTP